jgi:DNA-binding transcriptional LysR family regulator
LNDHQLASMAWQYAIAPFPASYQTGILVSELQGMWMDFANGMGGTHLAFTPGGDTPSDFAAEVLLWRRIACPASDSLPPAPPPPPAPPAPAAVLLPPPPTYGTTPGPGNINIGGAGSGTANGSFNGAGSGGRTSVPFDYTAACSAPSPSGEIRSPAWIANCLASLGQ